MIEKCVLKDAGERPIKAGRSTGVDGAEFSGNTILRPGKWIFRVLQETRGEGVAACRNGRIAGNRITFLREQIASEFNIGEGTAPETFVIERNRWLAEDRPQSSRPKLPVREIGGVYGK